MPSVSQRAQTALEEYLKRYRPGELQLVWRARVPQTDWGLPETTWRDRASKIIGRFNDLDPNGPQINRRLRAVRNALRYFYDKPVGQFEQYIIDKANGAAVPAAVEASPAGGDQ